MSVFKISSQVYLDKFNKCYKKIIVINEIPDDLKSHIRTVKKEKLSIINLEGRKWCDTYQYLINLYNKSEFKKRKY